MTPEQWLSMPELDGTVAHGSLEAGDIVMKQLYHIELAGAFITVGQKIAKALRLVTLQGFTADTQNEHAAIMIDRLNLVESIGAGVTMGVIDKGEHASTPYVVFRCTDRQLATDAAAIAKAFMGYGKLFNTARAGAINPGKYNLGGGTGSIFNPFGKTDRSTAVALMDRMRDFITGASNARPNVYCTQFVAACYVLAADWNAHPCRLTDSGLNINPAAMIPIVYVKCLSTSRLFHIVGRFGARDLAIKMALDKLT